MVLFLLRAWRVSFVIIALAGAAALFPVHGLPGGARVRSVADIGAVTLYLAIAVLAVIGGADMQRTVAVLLTALVFLGFNVAWLFLFAPLASADSSTESIARQEQPNAPATGQ
jgi:hypothetical protein